MSKAFLRESDFAEPEPLPIAASPLPPGAKNYMTSEGARQLRDELDHLLTVERPPLVAQATDDPETKRDLQRVDQRIRYVQQSLSTAEVVTPSTDDGVVRFGASVTVRDEHGEETRYRLVGVDETDLTRGWVSWMSPLARAILNQPQGAIIDFMTPVGPKKMEIISVGV